jgi:DNA-binding transcriptional MerR regulator
MMRLYSTRQFAEKVGVSPHRIRALCLRGRIKPAFKTTSGWILSDESTLIRSQKPPEKMVTR